jgi:hypothetical protein
MSRVPKLALAAVALVAGVLGSATPALGGAGENPEPFRIFWKPTFGSIQLTKQPDISGRFGEVYETFGWGTSVSVSQLDAPRLPSGEGMYEHEVRFTDTDPTTGDNSWCNNQLFPNVVAADLPEGYYMDNITDAPGEFTFGMHASLLEEDHVYDVRFTCESAVAPSASGFNVTSQIGHCHFSPLCVQQTTYADETNRLIPAIQGIAPVTGGETKSYTIEGTFKGNTSFESNPSPNWSVPNGNLDWLCSGFPYHSSCYVRVEPTGTSYVRLQLHHDPGAPQATAEGSTYSEFVVRCPSTNEGGCWLRIKQIGLNSAGNVTVERNSAFFEIPIGGWHEIRSPNDLGYPSGTVKWRFVLIAGVGSTGQHFHVDYHQQHFLFA